MINENQINTTNKNIYTILTISKSFNSVKVQIFYTIAAQLALS